MVTVNKLATGKWREKGLIGDMTAGNAYDIATSGNVPSVAAQYLDRKNSAGLIGGVSAQNLLSIANNPTAGNIAYIASDLALKDTNLPPEIAKMLKAVQIGDPAFLVGTASNTIASKFGANTSTAGTIGDFASTLINPTLPNIASTVVKSIPGANSNLLTGALGFAQNPTGQNAVETGLSLVNPVLGGALSLAKQIPVVGNVISGITGAVGGVVDGLFSGIGGLFKGLFGGVDNRVSKEEDARNRNAVNTLLDSNEIANSGGQSIEQLSEFTIGLLNDPNKSDSDKAHQIDDIKCRISDKANGMPDGPEKTALKELESDLSKSFTHSSGFFGSNFGTNSETASKIQAAFGKYYNTAMGSNSNGNTANIYNNCSEQQTKSCDQEPYTAKQINRARGKLASLALEQILASGSGQNKSGTTISLTIKR